MMVEGISSDLQRLPQLVTVLVEMIAVPVCVTVKVTSLIGTTLEQRAEAFKAMRTALQISTSPRGCRSGMCMVQAEIEKSAVVVNTAQGSNMFAVRKQIYEQYWQVEKPRE